LIALRHKKGKKEKDEESLFDIEEKERGSQVLKGGKSAVQLRPRKRRDRYPLQKSILLREKRNALKGKGIRPALLLEKEEGDQLSNLPKRKKEKKRWGRDDN